MPAGNETSATGKNSGATRARRKSTKATPSEREKMQNRKARRLRRHIAEVAVQLFEEKGFSRTTVEEIARAADYSPSTVFRLFKDKEEIVVYDFSEKLNDLKELFAAADHAPAWIIIRNAFLEFAKLLDEDNDRLSVRRARIYHSDPLVNARYLAIHAEWQDEIARLVSRDFEDKPGGHLHAQVFAGAAASAFRAAWRTKLEDERLLLADCVRDAFKYLEEIGLVFGPTQAECGECRIGHHEPSN